jgi:hypothetical protein
MWSCLLERTWDPGSGSSGLEERTRCLQLALRLVPACRLAAPTLPATDAAIRSEPPGADGSPGGATQSLEGAQSGGELGLLQPMCLLHVNHCA